MTDNLQRFKTALGSNHYSTAFIEHLVFTITSNSKINTLQEIHEVIKKQSEEIIGHFQKEKNDHKLIEYRNPLCFESLRQYFLTMTRGVYKKCGSDIGKFKEGLKSTSKELIEILASATQKIVKHSDLILRDNTAKKILVYSYSKSIGLSLKKLAKTLEDNLEVYVCKSGSLAEGIKLYEELVIDGVRCQLLNDNEVGYYMPQMTCVLVGAEVILDNGAILNRAGTSIVALLAHHSRKPFYVFAQSYKFLRKNYLTQKDIPQSFTQDKCKQIDTISIDLTSPEYITLFCTESGIYNPEIISLELSKILS